MPITPDTKDWTWVIERSCAECGFDPSSISEREVGALVRANAARWPAVLERKNVRDRPDEQTWSPLEYAAHVRDVYRVCLARLTQMLEMENPEFANWDQDATAIEDRYNDQDPAVVAAELAAAAEAIASEFERVPDDSWSRGGRRSDGADFTVASFALYVAHDPTHHLWDVQGRSALC